MESYSYDTSSSASINPIMGIIWLVLIVLMLAAVWKLFTKAGKPGWAAIVPIYSSIVELEIVGRPVWWIFLLFIPFVNFVVAIIVLNDLAKSFGKGTGTTLLLVFLPFIGFPMLAWGNASYVGPAASQNAETPAVA